MSKQTHEEVASKDLKSLHDFLTLAIELMCWRILYRNGEPFVTSSKRKWTTSIMEHF